jgi:hypothetical protein
VTQYNMQTEVVRKSAAGCGRMMAICFSAVLVMGMGPRAAPAVKQRTPPADFVPAGSTLFLVFSNNVSGKEAEFNAWYDRHMKDIVRLPGFIRAQRFVAESGNGQSAPPNRYLVLYEMRGETSALMAELGRAVQAGKLQAPDPTLVVKTEAMFYEPVTPTLQSDHK